MSDRTPRSNKSRDNEARKKTWQRPTMLPTPEPRDGVEYRWVRTSTLGQADNTNVSSKFREGWTPVKAEDHPELQVLPDIDSRFEGNVEVGGLLLCENSTEFAESRRDAHDEMNAQQIESVDNNYLRQSDPRMPVLQPERSTKTSFGK
tara:strand:- start:6079 stop:6522 length:444 start_codon:yes stop_codon:yes gene_type:complete